MHFLKFQTETFDEIVAIETHFNNFYVIGNVINSKRRRIRVAEFRAFCTDAMLHIKKHFEWKNIPDVVHEICAHVCDLIEENGGYGLGDLSEVCNLYFSFDNFISKVCIDLVHNIYKSQTLFSDFDHI